MRGVVGIAAAVVVACLVSLSSSCDVIDPAADLRGLSGVVSVSVHGSGPVRIIHLCDWHVADGADLADVAAVQAQQRAFILASGFRGVFLEGLTSRQAESFHEFARLVWSASGEYPVLQAMVERDRLELGTAGRMLVAGELDAVHGCEDRRCGRACWSARASGRQLLNPPTCRRHPVNSPRDNATTLCRRHPS